MLMKCIMMVFDCYVNEVHKDGCLIVMLMKCIRMSV